MAETARTALRPLPKIAAFLVAFVVIGWICNAGTIWQLALFSAIGFAGLAFAFGFGNFLERRQRVREIDARLKRVISLAERDELREERRGLATWPLR